MTIKQQGGIFGRNPTFNDLTVEGTLSGADTSLDGSVTINESAANKDFRVEGTTDNYLIYADADQQSVGIGISNPNSYAFNDPVKLAVGNTSGSTTLSIVSNPSSFGYLAFADGTSGASRYAGRIEYQHSTGSMYFYVNDGSQNISITSSGNLAFPSGNGIDFSATSDGGTVESELLNDYEDGYYTATLTPATSGTITLNTGYNKLAYTKVGRLVTVGGHLYVDSSSSPVGSTVDLNLPFTVDAPGTGSINRTARWSGIAVTSDGAASVLHLTGENATSITLQVDASTIGGTYNFRFGFSYIAA